MKSDNKKMSDIQTDIRTVHCQHCHLAQFCLPFSLSPQELTVLDSIIERKKPIAKDQVLFRSGDALHSLYAIRSGSIKSYTINEHGDEQITGLHIAGDLVGFEGIILGQHQNFAHAIETSVVCEIPYAIFDNLLDKIPSLRHQVMRLMSHEIKSEQEMILLLSKKSAEERLASFLLSLSSRLGQSGLSSDDFRLSMTRQDIANYLGLAIETVSRAFSRFQQNGVLQAKGKHIKIDDMAQLKEIANRTRKKTDF